MQNYIPYVLPAIFILLGGGLICIIARVRDGRESSAQPPAEREVQAQFCMGQYLTGFPGSHNTAPLVFCTVTEDDFVFTRGRRGREIGRIPRTTINLINIAPRSQVLGYVTVRDAIACEQVIPPASKRNKNYCLVVDWDDADGAPHNSIFEFMDKGDKTSAQHALECLEQWEKTRTFTVHEARAGFRRRADENLWPKQQGGLPLDV